MYIKIYSFSADYHKIVLSLNLLTLMFLFACNPENREWTRATDKGTIEAFEQYLVQYPKGEHATEASSILKEIRIWDSVTIANTTAAYQHYISLYPGGQYDTLANEQLNILETKAFKEAGKIDTYNSYDQFLIEFPDGHYADTATQLAHLRLVSEFRPDVILFIGFLGYDPLYGVWKGKLGFSLGQGGVFTGKLSFIPPDPSKEEVAVVVNDTTDMPSCLEKGKIYVWKGDEKFIFLRSFDVPVGKNENMNSLRDKLAEELNIKGSSGEVAEPIPFSRSWKAWLQKNQ